MMNPTAPSHDDPVHDDPGERHVAALAPKPAMLDALVRTGNLTRAAALLGVPQPTASRWLVELGKQLDTPLVVKVGRELELTRAGIELAAASRRALAALREGWHSARDESDPERGRVVLAFLHTMGGVRVPELLRGFRERHPTVRFTLVQGGHEGMVARLRSGEVDLVLTAPLPEGEPDLATRGLARQPLVLVTPAGHELSRRTRVRLTEANRAEFVALKPGYGLRTITDRLFAMAGFQPTVTFEGEEIDTLRGLVSAGLGIALLPRSESEVTPGTTEIPLSPPADRRIGLVWSRNRPQPPAVAAFRDYAAATAEEEPAAERS